jgi:hypothetical protein
MIRAPLLGNPPVLAYAPPDTRGAKDHAALRALVLVGCVPLVVAPFLSFTYSTSPVSVVAEGLMLMYRGELDRDLLLMNLAAVFFLGFPIVVWQLLLLISSSFGRIVHGVFRILAAVCVALTFPFLIISMMEDYQYGNFWHDWQIEVVPWITLLIMAGAGWLVRRRMTRNQFTSMCLIGGYLPNAFLCFAGFPSRDGGQYFAMVGCVALALEWAWILINARCRPALFAGINRHAEVQG